MQLDWHTARIDESAHTRKLCSWAERYSGVLVD